MSDVGILKRKAPLVAFDYMEYGQDVEASKKAGRPVPKVVPFVFITHDKYTRIELPAEEWLARKRNEAIEGKEDPDWVTRWEMQYAAWKKGETLPEDGQPIKTWAALNKEQVLRLTALGYLTVEQLSEVPDTNLAMIGLDGRYLRDLARKTLTQVQNGEALAKQVADLEQQGRDKDATIQGLMERVAALEKAGNTLHLKKG